MLIIRNCYFYRSLCNTNLFFSFPVLQGPVGWNTRRPRSGGSRAWTRSGSVTSCWGTLRRCGRSSTAATPSSTCRTRCPPASTWCWTCWVRATNPLLCSVLCACFISVRAGRGNSGDLRSHQPWLKGCPQERASSLLQRIISPFVLSIVIYSNQPAQDTNPTGFTYSLWELLNYHIPLYSKP